MRILCVAEKPSQAKSIVSILSNGSARTRNGCSRYNKNHDFEYRLNGTFTPATMTSVLGHILEIDFAADYRKWFSCNPSQLFTAPIVKSTNEKLKDIARNVEQEARTATHLYIWTDCDREGEGIGSEVAALCRKTNPRIVVRRAHFSSVLPQEIHHAMQNPRDLDGKLVEAVEARTELDLRVGSALTRFQTMRLQSRFNEVKDRLVSYGPCQFPTLGFVVDQFLRVESFVPETFWFLFLEHKKDDGRAVFTWKRTRLFDQETCFALYAKCVQEPTVRIVSVRSRPKEKWRPLPLTTVELQTCCAKFLRMSPDTIMSVAEGLYNQGFISYPRTETDQFDKNMDLMGTVTKLTQFQLLAAYAQRLVNGEFRWPRNGKNNDKAHPPIHPVAPGNNLTGDAKRVYEFVTRRFLACCSDNAKGQATEVDAEMAGERFFTNGLMILARNYLDIYPYDRWSESTVPVYRQGDTFEPTVFEMRSGSTTAPKLLTEGDLVKIMDKNGIGTDATYAEHIKKIIDREYIFRSPDSSLSPSTLGVGLVEGYDAIGLELSLTKPYLRREMEQELRKICDGHKSKADVIRESLNLYQAVYTKSTNEIDKLELALGRCMGATPLANAAWAPRGGNNGDDMGASQMVCRCPACDGNFKLRSRPNGTWMIGCDLYPQCRRAIWVPNVVANMVVCEVECQNCRANPKGPAKMLDITFKPGSVPPGVPTPYRGCVRGCDELINEIFGSNTGGGGGNVPPAPPQQSNNTSRSTSYQGSFQLPPTNLPQSMSNYPTHQPFQPPVIRPPPTTFRQSSNPPTPGLSDNHLCQCSMPSRRLITQKEGPNKGRAFFKCAKPADSQCDFFHWEDQPAGPPQSTNSWTAPTPGFTTGVSALPDLYTNHSNHVSLDPKPKCKCGLFALLKQTSDTGNNPGREYFACTKSYQGCGFVCWKEDVDSYMNGTMAPSPAVVTSECYRCQQKGHWARDCPNSDGFGEAEGSGQRSTTGPARRGRPRGKGRAPRSRGRGRGRGRGAKRNGSVERDVEPNFQFWD